ncbi:uncharacterized protein LOC122387167 [Amphibalanus amphitrite]|uniref:uncharacterized protein LOC122387167 n=1 Tax=Amphibalanus amphitrite TaxID=1232801 RepID=UPI001C908BF1|nr:uncharacterized protein LOC122387167 [Amphibalanus amphitrite]
MNRCTPPPLLVLLVLVCVLVTVAPAAASPALRRSERDAITCFSVHETFRLGEVFSDEHCRRVKCIEFLGEGFVIEVEKCPLPDIPEGADCTMTEPTEERFPLCCPKAVCGAV